MSKKEWYTEVFATALGVGLLGSPAPANDGSFKAWASDSLTKVMRDTKPQEGPWVIKVSGARGEVVSAQAVCWSREPVGRASFRIETLRHRASDATIPSSAVNLQWVRYIDVQRNSAGVPSDELVAKAPTSIPDPFWEDNTISFSAHQA